MACIGVICPPDHGHLNPMLCLGHELQERGHRVVFFNVADRQPGILSEGFACEVIAPAARVAVDKLSAFGAMRYNIGLARENSAAICEKIPAMARKLGVSLLLVDQLVPAGGSVAEHLGIPFVTICTALAFHRDPNAPPAFTHWSYGSSWWKRMRNRAGFTLFDVMLWPIARAINSYRRTWKLAPIRRIEDTLSPFVQISQQPRTFDFPYENLPESFHYVGPFRRSLRKPVTFPWERLDGRPLIYGSLGTLQNRRADMFRCMVRACEGLDVQLVLSHGGGLAPDVVEELSRTALVVSYAPQVDLLARARMTLTHGGLNTVLDSLSQGVPAIVMPIVAEQPGIAQRVSWTGCGLRIPFRDLTPEALRGAIRRILGDPSFYARAKEMQSSIHQAGGVKQAAAIVEQVLSSGRRVASA